MITSATADASEFGGSSSVDLTHESGDTYTATVSSISASEPDGTVTVSATDEYDNGGDQNEQGTLDVDNTDPTVDSVTLTDDTDGNSIVANGDSITITADVTDANTVDTVTADATAFGKTSPVTLNHESGDTYTATVSSISATEPDASVSVSATDEAGNGGSQSVDSSNSLTVDNTAPTVGSVTLTDDTDGNDIVADGDSVTITADVTDDSTITGVTADASAFGAGSSVTLSDDDSDGTYTKQIQVDDASATQGSQVVTVSATDEADNGGSQSVDSTDSLTVDTSAPALSYVGPTDAAVEQPTIEVSLSDTYSSVDESTIDVTVADSDETDGADVTQTGTGNGVSYTSGTLTIDLSQADETLVDGAVDVSVSAADEAENSASITETDAFTVDTQDPFVYNVELADDGDGLVADGDTVTVTADVTDDSTITSVTADASAFGGGAVTLTDDGTGADQKVDGTYTGEFQVDDSTATDGEQSVTVSATDEVNNGGTQDVESDSLTVDTTVPSVDAVQISDATDDNSVVADGDTVTITANVTDTNGIAEVTADAIDFGAGSSVTLNDDGPASDTEDDTYSAAITVDGSSTTDGDYGVTVSATDTAGNGGSQAVQSNDLAIDTTAPSISVTSPSDGAELPSPPSIDGTASDSNGLATVEVKLTDSQGHTWDGSSFTAETDWLTASGTQSWTYDTAALTNDGAYDVTVRATDVAGNTETTADPVVTYILDTTGPSVDDVQIADATDGNGVVANDDTVTITATVTDTNTITSVTADATGFGAESPVTLSDDGPASTTDDDTYSAEVEVDGSSTSDSDQSVTVSASDDAGNGGSQATESGTLTVDTTVPSVENVQITDTDDTGAVADGDTVTITANVTDTNGIAEVTADASGFGASSSLSLSDDGPASEADDDTYSAAITVDGSSTTDGAQSVTVSATDDAGNGGSQATESGTLVVDTEPPTLSYTSPTEVVLDQPTIEVALEDTTSGVDESSISVTVSNSNTEDGDDFDHTGTGNGVTYSTDSNTLSIDLSEAGVKLADGPVDVDVSASDVAANSNSISNAGAFTVDTTAPDVTDVQITDTTDDNSVVADGDTVTITATVTDANGIATVTADASAFGIESTVDLLDDGPASGADDDIYSTEMTVDGPSATEGDQSVTVSATDEADNGGTQASESNALTVDTSAPSVENVQITDSEDNGVIPDGDTVTITATVTDANGIATVTADASAFGIESTVDLLDNGPASDDGDDRYSAEIAVDGNSATEGEQTVTVSATDEADNGGSQAIESNSLTVDTGTPDIEYVSPTGEVNAQPTITVDLSDSTSEIDESSISVTVSDSRTIDGPDFEQTGTGNGVSYSDGTLIIDLQTASEYLAQGSVDVDISARDLAGNGVSFSESDAFIVDSAPPNVGSVELSDVADGDGFVTDGDTIKITAKASDSNTIDRVWADASGFGAGSSVDLTDENSNGTYTATVTIDDQSLSDGAKSVTVNATDEAGNGGSQAAESGTLTVDMTPPTADAGSDLTVDEGKQVSFDGTASSDNVGIETYEWDVDGDGTYELTDSTPTHTYDDPGTYSVTLRVTDAVGHTATDTLTVTVHDTTPPTAAAGSDMTAEAAESVSFDGTGSSDNVGIESYEWDVDGDGTYELSGSTPSYTYADTGTYTTELRVTDAAGNTATDTLTVSVEDTTPPMAEAGDDRTVEAVASVSFDGTDSSDNVGIESYEWDVDGDGTYELSGSTPSHTYADTGTYTTELRVTDAAGHSTTDTLTVTVEDTTAPTADAGSDKTVDEDTSLSFDGTGSSDNVGIESYEWDFDDGTTATGQSPTHTYDESGTYTVTLTVSDAAGNTATGTLTVTVEDVTDPTADAGSDKTVDEDSSVSFDGAGSSDNVGIESYEWNFGDGATATGQSPTHTYADPGTYTVTLTVSDAAGNTATDTAIVTVEDVTPPAISAFNVSNPSGQDVQVSFEANEQLSTIQVAITGAESATVTDFAETDNGDGTFTYEATYAGNTDGEYTAALETASDDSGNDGASDQSDSVSTDTTPPSIFAFEGTNPSGQDVQVSFEANEQLSTIQVAISGAESGTLETVDFDETNNGDSTYTYTATYAAGADGDYTVALERAVDLADNDGGDGRSADLTVLSAESFAGGDGTEASPYRIADWNDLDNVRLALDANYTLIADLDETTDGYDELASARANTQAEFKEDRLGDWSGTDAGETFELPYTPLAEIITATDTADDSAVNVTIIDAENGIIELQEGTDRRLSIDYRTTEAIALGWEPIRDPDSVRGFTGTFDGQGHTIADLTINRPGANRVGLFSTVESGRLSDGTVTDLTLADVDVTGGDIVGGIAGYHGQAARTIKHVSVTGTVVGEPSESAYETGAGAIVGINLGLVENATGSASVEGSTNVGGLVGSNRGTLTNSTAIGDVTADGDNVGGIVGANGGTVASSSASGIVNGSANVGGLVGTNQGGTVTESYATGSVDGTDRVGGLVGENTAAGDAATTNTSYATGAVTATGSEIGGLVGLNDGSWVNTSYAAGAVSDGTDAGGLVGNHTGSGGVTNAYWDTETTGQTSSAGNATGLSASELKGDAAKDNTALDFTNTWAVVSNTEVSYPYLQTNTQTPAPGLEVLDSTPPTISNVAMTNPSGQDVQVSFDADEQLAAIEVSISDAESATLTTGDFTETDNGDGTYTYESTYAGSSDGTYTATLEIAEDAAGNDGATGHSGSVSVSTSSGGSVVIPAGDSTAPTISQVSATATADGDITVTVESDEQLATLGVALTRSETQVGSLTATEFTEATDGDSYSYSAIYSIETDGIYTVSVESAQDAAGNDGAAGQSDTVTIDTTPPTAVAGTNQTVNVTESVSVNGSASTDGVGIANYSWTFEDGPTVSGVNATQTYAVPGIYTATLTVMDEAGHADTDTLTITVEDTTPPAISAFNVSNPVAQDIQISFEADTQLSTIAVSITGAENATLTAGDFTETDTGDGTYAYEGTYAGSSNGTYIATLASAEDAAGNDGATGHSDSVSVTTDDGGDEGDTGDESDTGDGDESDTGDGDESDTDDGDDSGSPDQDATVTVEQDSAGSTVATITNATTGSTVVIDNSTTGGVAIGQAENITVDSLRTDVTTDREFWLNVSTYSESLQTATGERADEGVEQAARDFENETGTVAAGYVRVEHNLDESDVSNATFAFSVRQAYLDDLSVGPRGISLYRQHDGAWSAVPTSFVGENATHYRFEGVSPGYSVFALGTSAPKFDVADAALAKTRIGPDETTTLTATIANRGNADGTHTLSLTADSEEFATETVTVAGQSTATVEFSVERPVGEWELALDGEPVETLVVDVVQQTEDTPTTATDTPTDQTTTDSPTTTTEDDTAEGSPIPWLAGGLGVAVLVVAVLALRRRGALDGD